MRPDSAPVFLLAFRWFFYRFRDASWHLIAQPSSFSASLPVWPSQFLFRFLPGQFFYRFLSQFGWDTEPLLYSNGCAKNTVLGGREGQTGTDKKTGRVCPKQEPIKKLGGVQSLLGPLQFFC